MPKNLPGIEYMNEDKNLFVDSENAAYMIPFYKGIEFFSSPEAWTAFIKGCEKLVRVDERYKAYIAFLKNEVKLNRCEVLKDVDDRSTSIEMHHGPIFTLFDVCAIVLEYFLVKNLKVTTFRIAKVVLEEHELHHVQVVMLSKTIHQEVHNGDLFIHYKQSWGDLKAFCKKYGSVMPRDYKEKYNRYVDKCLLMDSSDNGILELSNKLWNH